ncbi:MAG: 2,5-dioxovalerate dehydrogenase [Rhodothermaceae bacterium]|nr:MAG: 2,5-dioxovalerate dehydrogenase [Rhodothermaceae bacterium]
MTLHGQHLIAGTPSGAGPAVIQAVNPVTGEALAPAYPEATPDEIDRALDAATEAFHAGRTRTPEERAALLERIADEIEALGDVLIERVMAETGLPEGRVRGERGRTTGQLRLFADVVREGSWVGARIDTADPDRRPVPKPDVRRMLVPLGPVVVFGASNFPLAFSVAGGDTASALAAGCPVVCKAHPAHPGTSELVGRAIDRAVAATGFPPGTFSLLHGATPETGLALVRHPQTRAVGFTGSLRAGRALFDAAAARPDPIPVYAEMGSVNPVFLLPGALSDRGTTLAEGLAASVTLGAGQFCTNPGLVFAPRGDALDAFLGHLGAVLATTSAGTMLHAGIRAAYEAGLDRWQATEGVRPVAAGPADDTATPARPAVFTTDAETFARNPHLHEEVFGPATLVVQCDDPATFERLARRLEGNLTASLHGTGDDLRAHAGLIRILEDRVGRLIFNGFPTGVEVCHAMHHGGPYPATTDVRSTSVGTAAIFRFARPVCYQNFPQAALPPELRDDNPRGLWRLVDGTFTREALHVER